MRNSVKKLMLLTLFLVSGIIMHASAQNPRKGVIRVKLQPQVALQLGNAPRVQSNGVLRTGIVPLDKAGQQVGAVSMKRVFPYAPKFEAQMSKAGLDRWYEVTFDENVDPVKAATVYRNTSGVQHAHSVVPMVLKEGVGNFRKVAPSSTTSRTSDLPFNDPRLYMQWHYNNNGSIAGCKAGADINLFEAWKTTTGRKDVVVAIVDGGVDISHEDLNANMMVNLAELNGIEGVDDDGNGYVDDINGWNFCTNTNLIYPHNHGTHVAGTVAAVNNNGIGVSGVAGGDGTEGSGISMISCQVFDSRSGTAEGDFAAAIVYAAHRGASIAQCSWGWAQADYYEQSVLDAIDYFTQYGGGDNLTGGLCIFASGNYGATGNFYPGCYDKVVAVGSMSSDYTIATYSNYGSWIDIVAPGGLLDYGEQGGVLSTLPDNSYGFNEGTSMATPHVSGIAALVLSKHGKKNMPNETLRQQLLTSVNDIYAYNPGTEGLHGSGYIDAAKALEMGTGEAPAAVDVFTVTTAQDNATFEWIIPTSSDNNVNHHVIYYSEQPFDASTDLSTLKSVVVDTKFQTSGDKFVYELKGLASTTTYYFAIKAVNRWGNASALSPIVSATTNAGPLMSLNKTSLSFNITEEGGTASSSFIITNKDEGLLKWSAFTRNTKFTPKAYDKNNYPGKMSAYNSKLIAESVQQYSVVKSDEYFKDDYPQSIAYHSSHMYNIGDEDPTLPNAMAQLFTIDAKKYPNGFNLTDIYVEGKNGKKPVIEIYNGNGISEANLIQKVSYSYWSYSYDIALSEQLLLEPGLSYWVVVKFAASTDMYPLGVGKAATSSYMNNCYISNNDGETWTRLAEALKGSQFESIAETAVWAITLKSKNPDWSQVFKMTPSEGSIKYNENQEVTISNDGQPLINGTYKFNVRFNTNETGGNDKKVATTVTVSGGQPKMTAAKVINFGNLLVGESKTIAVEAVNLGYGPFGGKYGTMQKANITSSSEHFPAPTSQSAFAARSTSEIKLTYTPKSEGSHTGTITFISKDGIEFKLTVQGVATNPAHIAVSPDTIEAGDLDIDAAATVKEITIKNEGNYPLEYVFPKFSDEKIAGQTKTAHKFGYSALTNLGDANSFEHDNAPELIGTTDITSQFNDKNNTSKAIALGFDFPFYGKTYDAVYINSLGGLAFSISQYSHQAPLTETSASLEGVGYITAYGHQLQLGPNSSISYAKQDGKFVVSYKDVLAVKYASDCTPISFRIMLSSNGDVEVFYDDYNNTVDETGQALLFQSGSTLFCAIKDPEGADPLLVTSGNIADYWNSNDDPEGDLYKLFTTGSAVKFEAPKANFVTSLAPATGIVNPGESTTVTVTLKADSTMIAGKTFNRLAILSNDPAEPTSYVTINANICGETLKPSVALESDKIEFGKVFRTSVAKKPLTVKNNGKDSLAVTEVSLNNNVFTTDAKTPFTIPAGQSKDIIITLPTANEGAAADVITIVTSAGTMSADITGEVIGCPGIKLSYTEYADTLTSGTVVEVPLTVSNTGDENLVYSAVATGAILEASDSVKADSKVSYIYTSSADDSNITHEWVDIETNGLGEQNNLTYYVNHDYVEVDLKFDFPFYGKKYNKMYIYNTGFISFTKRNDENLWPEPPADFPNGTVYTNIIAPYWGLHSMDQTKTAGTFHYVTDDEAVVSFMEYGNSMNIGVCFQVIMKKDGSFKFQYKGQGEYAVIFNTFGLAGISNLDGSEGMAIPERYISFGNAVQFSPVVEQTLAPGESRVIDAKVNAKRMGGEYKATLTLNSNVPASETIEVPYSVTITGKPEPVFPDSIYVEHVIGYMETENPGPLTQMGASYEAFFKIENPGTATFQITDIVCTDQNMAQAFPVYCYQSVYDSWFDQWTSGWMQWTPGFSTPVEVGSEGFEVSVPMMMYNYEVGTYDVPLKFYVSGIEGVESYDVNVRFKVTPAPLLSLNKSDISVNGVAPDFVGKDTLTITNNGEYKLTYTLKLDPTGVGEESNNGGGGIAPWSANALTKEQSMELRENFNAPLVTFDKSTEIYNTPQDFQHDDALFYSVFPGNSTAYFYGTGNTYATYKAATYYVAPEEGFNISHIYAAATMESLKDADITVQIISGDNPDAGTVLGTGTFHVDEMPSASFIIIPLDRAVYMNPGQDFYVVITYPAGVEYPAALCVKEEAVVSNRYMGWVEGYGWFDIATMFKDQGSLGYIMSCLQTVAGDAWIKMNDNVAKTGEIEVGESLDIDFTIDAAAAPLETGNKAVLVIKSNDPSQPVVNFPIYLNKNASPVITPEEGTIYAEEGATTTTTVTVCDPNDDDMTIDFMDESGLAKIVKAESISTTGSVTTAADGAITVTGETEGVKLTVEITADYGQAGKGAFNIRAIDNVGNTSKAKVQYEIAYVNRAPEAVKIDDITIGIGQVTPVINFDELFTDADNDALTYTFSVETEGIVSAFTSDNSVMFIGLAYGTTTVKVIATDTAGQSTENVFTIKVDHTDGISNVDINANIAVYPNPVIETLNVTCNFSSDEVTFAIFDYSGKQVYISTDAISAGTNKAINVSAFNDGVYILKVCAQDGATSVFRFIKK